MKIIDTDTFPSSKYEADLKTLRRSFWGRDLTGSTTGIFVRNYCNWRKWLRSVNVLPVSGVRKVAFSSLTCFNYKGRSGMVGQFNSYSRPSVCLLLHCLHCRSCWWSLCNGQVSTGSNLTIPDEWERHIGIQKSAYRLLEAPFVVLSGDWLQEGRRRHGQHQLLRPHEFGFQGSETSWIIELVPCLCAVIKHLCLQYILSHLWGFQETSRNQSF